MLFYRDPFPFLYVSRENRPNDLPVKSYTFPPDFSFLESMKLPGAAVHYFSFLIPYRTW